MTLHFQYYDNNIKMKQVKRENGYDFYIGQSKDNMNRVINIYNIVLSGSKPPVTGYPNKGYIEHVKGQRFDNY